MVCVCFHLYVILLLKLREPQSVCRLQRKTDMNKCSDGSNVTLEIYLSEKF